MHYVDVQTLWDADYPAGMRRYYWKSIYIDGLSDEVIDSLLSVAENAPRTTSNIDIWHMGGAVGRIGASDSAIGLATCPI